MGSKLFKMDQEDKSSALLFPEEEIRYVEDPYVNFQDESYKDLVRYYIDGHHVVKWRHQNAWHSNCRHSDDYVVLKWQLSEPYHHDNLELLIEDVRNITAFSSSYYFVDIPTRRRGEWHDFTFTFYTRHKLGTPYRPDNKFMKRLWKITYMGYIHCCFVIKMPPLCVLMKDFTKQKPIAPVHFESDPKCVKDMRCVSMKSEVAKLRSKRKSDEVFEQHHFIEYMLSVNSSNDPSNIIQDLHGILQLS